VTKARRGTTIATIAPTGNTGVGMKLLNDTTPVEDSEPLNEDVGLFWPVVPVIVIVFTSVIVIVYGNEATVVVVVVW